MPRIRFIEVGRNKLTWEEDLKNIDESSLVRAIQRKGALMSQDISVEGSDIIVGGLRTVGRTELVSEHVKIGGTL